MPLGDTILSHSVGDKMKTIIIAVLLSLFGHMGYCADGSFTKTGGGNSNIVGTLADEAGLAYDRVYYLSPDIYGARQISASVVYTSTTFSAVTFTSTSYILNGKNITITSHGLETGVDVVFTEGSGTAPGGLTDSTTYFVAKIDANTIALGTSKANAVAGTYVTLISSTTGNDETYTLTPVDISGTPSFKWQGGNGEGIFDLEISSVTISEYTLGGVSTGTNFGYYNYDTLILNVIAPTTGGIYIKSILNLKE